MGFIFSKKHQVYKNNLSKRLNPNVLGTKSVAALAQRGRAADC